MVIVLLLAVVGGGAWGLGVFDKVSQGGYEAPGSEAAQAQEVASEALGSSGGDLVVIYGAPQGGTVDDPAVASRIERTLGDLPPGAVTDVTSYWRTPAPQLTNSDHTSGLATITLAGSDLGAKTDSYERIEGRFQVRGVETDVAGQIPVQQSMTQHTTNDLAMAEAVSLPVVLVLLVIIFGGVVAASLPVLVGGLAVFGSLGLLHLISLFAEVNVFAVNVASLLGLGLAIDYGLFIVGRFREELAAGASTGEAVRRSVATAGRTVAFSATLLVVALGGLLLFPQSFLRSLAFGGMSAVALAAVISLTLLPAILGMLGHRVDKLAVPWRGKRSGSASGEGRGWRRFADGVMKRPLLTAVPIVAVLLLLGSPFLNTQFGAPDERILPENDPARQAIETLQTEFPGMSSDAVQVVLQGHGSAPPAPAVQRFAAEVGQVPGIDTARSSGAGGDVVVLNASLTTGPYTDQANQAVTDVRGLTPPGGSEMLVGGPTALNLDSLRATADQLPWVAALLIGATLVLMFLAFGSVLLPIKAVVMSALSLSATFGVLSWIFVQGYGADLINVTPAPVSVGIIVLMASVVFGLSTDYEVFLLSRMVEARAGGASTEEAVRTGLVRTGRMITAAALLLIVVTGAFSFSSVTIMRLVGVGMIVALALDATVVRMILVPAVLKLMGRAAWWAPGPLKRLQQRVGVGEAEESSSRREHETAS
ncbi:MMPL family transporter [Halosaccharopolyspora lacisalsi]|uniref:MMPL family transporter n=1 Tax=Halosaccharopolyspora lacisalsi TaxID=1000566 RepID=UPI002E29EB22|nr:MMPL family transporter [Halosaccharopolyspora lacisalsi]